LENIKEVKILIKKIIIINDERVKIKPCKNFLQGKFFVRDRIESEYIKVDKTVQKTNDTQKIKKFEKEVVNNKSKKKKLTTFLFFILNVLVIGGILIFSFKKDDIKPLDQLIAQHPTWKFFLLAVGLAILFMINETIVVSFLMKKNTKKFKFFTSYKTAAVGKYYDCVTPLSTGGQPFQIYYLNKKGFKGDIATSIPLCRYFLWLLGSIICGLISLSISYKVANPLMLSMAGISLGALSLLFIFIVLVSVSKKIGQPLVVGGLKILYKLRIVKDYKKALFKTLTFVKNYQKSVRSFSKNIWLVLLELLLTIISLVIKASIVYSIYLMFNYPVVNAEWFEIITRVFLCEMAVCLIPLPGNTGGAEFSFYAMFAQLFNDGTLFWAMLIYRFLTYYGYLLQGIGLYTFSFISKKIKAKKVSIN